jgi:hypothetical protein
MDPSRLDYLEGRVEEQSRNWERLFAQVGRVDQKIDLLGDRVSAEVGRLDKKIDVLADRVSADFDRLETTMDVLANRVSTDVGRLDQKIDALGVALSTRIESIDQRLDGKIDGVRRELAAQFHWTIGIMTALFTGVLAAILTR